MANGFIDKARITVRAGNGGNGAVAFHREKYIAAGNLAPLKEDYEALLLNRNNKVRVLEPNHEYTGLSLGINEDGELLVEKEDGTVTAVYAGEVSVRGVYGYV